MHKNAIKRVGTREGQFLENIDYKKTRNPTRTRHVKPEPEEIFQNPTRPKPEKNFKTRTRPEPDIWQPDPSLAS